MASIDFPFQRDEETVEKVCETCRFWSDMVAHAIGSAPMEALCLSETGTKVSEYTTGRMSCESWKSGHHGAVDSPPSYGETAEASYEVEEREEYPDNGPTDPWQTSGPSVKGAA